jgi:hypothetical protein
MLEYLDLPFVNTLWILLALSWVIVNIFWCIEMQKALLLTSNTKMQPQNVWLVYVPLFGLVWQFLVVAAVADSLGEEYHRRGVISREARPGYASGTNANVLLTCAVIPAFGIAIALFSNIPRIIHLTKIKNYRIELEKIIQTQMQYPQQPQIPLEYFSESTQSVNEEMQKNNPERFMPPRNPEEEYDRWRKK